MVTANITVTWDGVQFPVTAGQVVDIPAGSALETAYGTANLAALNAQQIGSPETLPDGGAV
jgi:hypothetical protein